MDTGMAILLGIIIGELYCTFMKLHSIYRKLDDIYEKLDE